MAPEALDERVLILAPTGRDGVLLRDTLARVGTAAEVCATATALATEMRRGVGALVLTEEALGRDNIAVVRAATAAQPTWSDVPIVLLIDSRTPGEERAALPGLEALGNVTIVTRPVGVASFLSAIRSALRGRRRQYEIGRHLAELEANNRAKDEFVAMLAHELRNPLAAVRTAVEVVARTDVRSEDVGRARQVVERQMHRLVRLLDDLLDASRIVHRKVSLSCVTMDLRVSVAEALAGGQREFSERRLEVVADLSPEPVVVSVDAERIAQVFDNLLVNAAKYTPAGGRVTVTLREEDGEAVCSVADTGIGLRPSEINRIFDLFVQVNPTFDRARGGLGVGLTIVRGLVDLHGGHVSVTSDGPGRGTRFTVRLPLAARGLATAPAMAATGVARSPQKVLVVEDNEDLREMMRFMLALQGHTAEVVGSGAEALAVPAPPDVVLVDIGLPGINGFEVARGLRARFGADVRLIAVTGYGQAECRDRAAAAGFDDFLVKPVGPEHLARALVGEESVKSPRKRPA